MHGKYPMVAAFDLLVCLLLIFVILALTQQTPSKPTVETQGLYAVVVTWPAGSNDDVDLYVEDPLNRVSYFASRDTGFMHLETDDLGTAASGTTDFGGKKIVSRPNGERTIIKGVIPGEYIVNVHMYLKVDTGPIVVHVALWELRGHDHIVVQRDVTLHHSGDEITVFRFTLTAIGDVKPGSINRLDKSLVSDSDTQPVQGNPDANVQPAPTTYPGSYRPGP